MNKRISFVVFSLLIAFSLILSACGTANTNTANTEENNAEDTASEEANAEEADVEEADVEETEAEEADVEETEAEEADVEESAEPMTLRLASVSDPDTLDPHKTGAAASDMVNNYLGASLVYVDPEGNTIPYLAESWDISEDGLTYTFNLRDDVLFHDGTPLTAQDFVYTYTRAIDPEIASPSAGPSLGPVESFEALDDYTFVVKLQEPFFPFLFSIAAPGYLQPLLQSYVEEAGDDLARNPIGVGPYKMVEWVTGDHILLEKNPDFVWGPEYYGSGPYNIDFIEIRIIPELATIVAGLEAGEIDYAGIEPKDLALFEELDFDILEQPQPGLRPYITFQNQAAPLDDINVRIGLNMAIDRQAALNLLEQGNGVVQYGPLSPSQIGYSPVVEEHGYPYDPEGAKAKFEEAGYELNADGVYEKDGELLSFSLYTLTIESWVKAAEVMQSMFAEVGVQIEIVQDEQGVLIPKILGGDYQMSMFGMTSAEADIMYQMFHSSQIGGFNYAFVDNPELDALLESTRTLTDPAERQQAVEDAQVIIAEQAYFLPLYAPINFMVINQRVKDYIFSPLIGMDYTQAYIE